MAEEWFAPPVSVRDVKRVGLTLNINNVTRAAEVLLSWQKRGPKWRAAVEACIDAHEGRKTAAEVRKAFEAAAKESGMLRSS
jgi:hypothetical protein